ncbi:MAG: hypothetical protein KF901_32035 [Myxococcales bacterium]|nr:hypothetical protein [Myxococcales bacterium]
MSAPQLTWLDTLYQVLDTDFEEPPERLTLPQILAKTRGLGELEILSWLLVEEMGPEGLESFEPLIDRPGGEQLYHGVLVLTQAPLYLDHGTFEQAGVTPPPDAPRARFLVRLRDYATRGETDRVWFFVDGVVRSVDERGKVTREVDDAGTFVRALASALL